MKVFFRIEDFGSDFIATHLLKTFHDDPRLTVLHCSTVYFKKPEEFLMRLWKDISFKSQDSQDFYISLNQDA